MKTRQTLSQDARQFLNEGKPKPAKPDRLPALYVRLPPEIHSRLFKLSGQRKADRKHAWKLQDITAEALRYYLDYLEQHK